MISSNWISTCEKRAAVTGPSGLIEFARFDLGSVLREQGRNGARNVLRILVGNPLVMKQLVKHVPDAGSHAPATILVDEWPDGVHLSYDNTASFLSSCGSTEALKVAQGLHAIVEALVTLVAS